MSEWLRLSKKTGVLLLNMGGPDDARSVKPFLYNLFSDPDIIRLPFSFLMQKLLAAIIVSQRGDEAIKNYARIGGGSPQLAITRSQADALKASLAETGLDIPVYIAMRYWHPFTSETVEKIREDNIQRLIVVSLYPHFSYTTTGSSLKALRAELLRNGLSPDIELSVAAGYAQDDLYLRALAACIEEGLAEGFWSCPKEQVKLLFSAHSLPKRHVKRTRDPYPEHIYRCAETVMKQYFPRNLWDLAYQSKVGKMPWLGPSTDGVMHYYAGLREDNILVVPISFVSDHIETLAEIDLDYLPLARDLQIRHIHRAPVMNTRPVFIRALRQQVINKLVYRFSEESLRQKIAVEVAINDEFAI